MVIIEQISIYLDNIDWQQAFRNLSKNISLLPINPEPEYSKVINLDSDDYLLILNKLTNNLIGEGMLKILQTK
jgi:hypothetical protein